jgi:hypothetical protein
MSFNIAISKDELNQINESGKEEHYECNNEIKVRNYKCTGTWVIAWLLKLMK